MRQVLPMISSKGDEFRTTEATTEDCSDAIAAARLQRQFDAENAMNSTSVGTESEEWVTVDNCSKKEKKSKRAVENAVTDEKRRSPDLSPGAANKAQDSLQIDIKLLISEVSNLILNKVFGEFWEFNDSSVSPICLPTIAKAFESTNSAYILVYRSKLQIASEKYVVPDAPNSWLEIVESENTSLRKQRDEYEEYLHASKAGAIDICIRCPAHVQIDESGGALLKLVGSNSDRNIPQDMKHGIFIRCLNSTTLIELKNFLNVVLNSSEEAKYGVSVNDDDLSIDKSNSASSAWKENSASELKQKMEAIGRNINPLSRCGASILSILFPRGSNVGWYPIETLDYIASRRNNNRHISGASSQSLSYDTTTIGDIVQVVQSMKPMPLDEEMFPAVPTENICLLSNRHPESNDDAGRMTAARCISLNMLLWDGKSIDSTAFQSGSKHEPRLFAIKLLASHPKHAEDRPLVVYECEIWINGSMLVSQLCDHVKQWVRSCLTESPEKIAPHASVVLNSPVSVYVIETYGDSKNNSKGK